MQSACIVRPKCRPWCISGSLRQLRRIQCLALQKRLYKNLRNMTHGFFLGPMCSALSRRLRPRPTLGDGEFSSRTDIITCRLGYGKREERNRGGVEGSGRLLEIAEDLKIVSLYAVSCQGRSRQPKGDITMCGATGAVPIVMLTGLSKLEPFRASNFPKFYTKAMPARYYPNSRNLPTYLPTLGNLFWHVVGCEMTVLRPEPSHPVG